MNHPQHSELQSGVGHWKMQRISALLLIPLTLWMLFSLLQALSYDFDAARAWVSQTHVAVLLVLWLLAAIYHAQLGIEIIIEDYVSDFKCRKAFIRVAKTLLYVALVLAIVSIIRVAFL